MSRLLSANGKEQCRQRSRAAVKRGLLIKPDLCERCHKKRRLQIHHHDYTKPLVVRWVCNTCHPIEDRTRRVDYPKGFKMDKRYSLNLYFNSTQQVRDIKRKAKAMGQSVSKLVIAYFDSVPDVQ